MICIGFRGLQLCLVWLVLTSASGCASLMFREEPGITYAKSVRQLGIYPVYPPREDLQVGDIYGVEDGEDIEDVKRHSVYVASIDLTRQIKDFLDGRYKFAITASGTVDNDAILGKSAKVPGQKDSNDGEEVLQFSDLETLPITGFPAIEVDSGLAVGVQGGSQSLAAIFGFAAAKTLKMRLQFGAVTSYAIPIPMAYDQLMAYCVPGKTSVRSECSTEKLSLYIDQKYQRDEDETKHAIPMLVSKVYLARAISYTFNDREMAAAAAAIAGGEGQSAPPTVNGELLQVAVAGGDAELVKALAAFQLALNKAQAEGSNGVSVSIAGFSQNSVTFEEVYQRPVVIGYEAVYIDPIKVVLRSRNK